MAQANGPNLLSTLLPGLAGTLLFSYIFRVSHLPGDLWHVCLVFLLFHFGKKQQAGDLYRDEESLLLLLFAFSGDLNFVGLFATGSLRRRCYGKRGVRSHNLPGQLRNAECCPIWQPYLWQPIVAVNFSAVEDEDGAKCLETWEKVLKVAPIYPQLKSTIVKEALTINAVACTLRMFKLPPVRIMERIPSIPSL